MVSIWCWPFIFAVSTVCFETAPVEQRITAITFRCFIADIRVSKLMKAVNLRNRHLKIRRNVYFKENLVICCISHLEVLILEDVPFAIFVFWHSSYARKVAISSINLYVDEQDTYSLVSYYNSQLPIESIRLEWHIFKLFLIYLHIFMIMINMKYANLIWHYGVIYDNITIHRQPTRHKTRLCAYT